MNDAQSQTDRPSSGEGQGPRRGFMRMETSLGVLAALAILYTAYLAQNLVAPITAAVVASFIFTPLMRVAPFRFLPAAVSSAIIVTIIAGSVAGAVWMLAEPAAKWMDKIPAGLQEIEEKSREISKPVEAMRRASKQVKEMTQPDDAPREVVVREEGFVSKAMEAAGQKGASVLIFIVLLYFLLATGELIRDRIIRSAHRLTDKEKARRILVSIEREISTYLLSIGVINAGLGASIGLAMWAIGLPNAALWGVAAGLLNFVPYAGAVAGMALTGFVAFMTFDSVGHALLAPALYFFCNFVESQFVTPSVLGRRHTLNAAVVFVSIVFWGWMWGIIGAVLAVPILVIMNTCFAQIEGMRKFSLFIDGSATPTPAPLPE
ncbi:MAG: AI-2E family transporter [Parvibaculum sp.]